MTPNQKPNEKWEEEFEDVLNYNSKIWEGWCNANEDERHNIKSFISHLLQSQAQEIIGEIELKKKELKGETYFGNRFTKQGCGTEDKKIGYNQAIQDLEEIKNKIKERYGTK